MKRPIATRFWAKVDKDSGFAREGMTPCWIWTGADDGRTSRGEGYGKFKYGEKYIRAHRVAYMITKGDIGEGLVIMHKCDNPKCVNPDHLKPGTHADNMADKMAKGRGSGWRRYATAHDANTRKQSRLTREQILEICASDKPNRQLAREYGLASAGSIRAIKTGKSYTAITHSLRTSLPPPSHEESAYTPGPPPSPSQIDPSE